MAEPMSFSEAMKAIKEAFDESVRMLREHPDSPGTEVPVRAPDGQPPRERQRERPVLHRVEPGEVPLHERYPSVTLPVYKEEVTVFAHRVDDFNDRRYEVSITVVIPAESVGEAIEAAVSAMREIGVA